ncbi:hypothetical protein AYI68_g1286 [Smittium mucronatum]|uniref:Uncharacterized protein n=1 Tax=Smittium mucronatum TaxID=133383 RepID=A0A1R0H608_9FUNG|nr:hypothetical protein AYI68_g1286 [Smittium mucronatum]
MGSFSDSDEGYDSRSSSDDCQDVDVFYPQSSNRELSNTKSENSFNPKRIRNPSDEIAPNEIQASCFGYEAKLYSSLKKDINTFETKKYLVPWYEYSNKEQPLIDR